MGKKGGDVRNALSSLRQAALERRQRKKRLLVVFPELFQKGLGSALLFKDVGAIPYYMAKIYDWDCALMYVDQDFSVNVPAYEKYVTLVPIKAQGGRGWRLIKLGIYIMTKCRGYDVLNLYHDTLSSMMLSVCFKLVNPCGRVYIKLDLNLVDAKNLMTRPQKFYAVLKKGIKRLASKLAVDLYTVETKQVETVVEKYPQYKKKLHLLPNGFSTFGSDWQDVIFSEKENIILSVGRLGLYEKNNEMLIDAIAQINPDQLRDWKVYLVGPIVNERFRHHVNSVVEENPYLKDILVFTGNIENKEDLFRLYARSKIFCMTSRVESFGLTLLEAMYFGNYVISSAHPAAIDLTKNGELGELFDMDDEKVATCLLSNLIVAALLGEINIEKKGRKAHHYVALEYNWQRIAERLYIMLDKAW